MKKGIRLFVTLLLLVCVNHSYSQFYDVKKIRRIPSISTISENENRIIFSKNETLPVPPSIPSEDTLSVRPLNLDLLSPPLDTLIVSSSYGYRTDPFTGKRKFHHGTDFVTSSDNVYSMMPGRIKKVGYNKVLGNYIILDHGEFRVTYAHLHTVIGEKGDFVQAGQSVGISGNTGRSTGEHLHLSMQYKNKSVDPYPLVRYIKEWSQKILSTPVPSPAPSTDERLTAETISHVQP